MPLILLVDAFLTCRHTIFTYKFEMNRLLSSLHQNIWHSHCNVTFHYPITTVLIIVASLLKTYTIL